MSKLLDEMIGAWLSQRYSIVEGCDFSQRVEGTDEKNMKISFDTSIYFLKKLLF